MKQIDGVPPEATPPERARLAGNLRAKKHYWRRHDLFLERERDGARKRYKQEWRARNRDRLLAEDKCRYWANREKNLSSAAEWRRRNQARVTQYRADNRDKARRVAKEYQRANPDKYLAYNHTRRAKTMAGGRHTDAEWKSLLAHYHHTCLRCGRREPEVKVSRDHVIPLKRGGSNTIDNIQPLCKSCNSWKNARTIDFRLSYSSVLTMSLRTSANHPGPAEELSMILPLTADSASLKHSPASTTNDASSSR